MPAVPSLLSTIPPRLSHHLMKPQIETDTPWSMPMLEQLRHEKQQLYRSSHKFVGLVRSQGQGPSPMTQFLQPTLEYAVIAVG
jgi:hypothetical protein